MIGLRRLRQRGELRRFGATLARCGFAQDDCPNGYQQVWRRPRVRTIAPHGRLAPRIFIDDDIVVLTSLGGGGVEAELTIGGRCTYFYARRGCLPIALDRGASE